MMTILESKNSYHIYMFLLFLILINHLQSSFAKHSGPTERYLECEISLSHHVSKSCIVVTNTCTIDSLYGFDNDTRLVFTNAKERNFTEVSFREAKFPVLGKYIAEQFPQMEKLKMEDGSLKKIKDFAFQQASNLRELHLYGNDIEEITYSTFKGADNLKHLDLATNKIKEVRYEVFESISELEILKLSHNKLTKLEDRTFSPLKKLKRLELYANEIKAIHPSIIAENRQLYHLELDRNPLEELYLQISSPKFGQIDLAKCSLKKLSLSRSTEGTNEPIIIRKIELYLNKFDNLMNIHVDDKITVQNLGLTYNEVTQMDDAPEFFQNVTVLDLSGNNRLKRISPKALKKITNLEKLELENTLVSLTPNMFKPLKQLKSLNLVRIKLESINVETFSGLTRLEHLDLEYNDLSDLDYKRLVKVLPSLRTIDIDRNYFSCDFVREMVEYWRNNTELRVIENPEETFYHFKSKYSHGVMCDTVYRYGTMFHSYAVIVLFVVAIITAIVLVEKDVRMWWSQRSYRSMTANPIAIDIQATVDGSNI